LFELALAFPFPPAAGDPRFAMHRGEGTLPRRTCACACACAGKGARIVSDCCPRKLNTVTVLLEIEKACVEWKAKRKKDTQVHTARFEVGIDADADADDRMTLLFGRDLVSDLSAIRFTDSVFWT